MEHDLTESRPRTRGPEEVFSRGLCRDLVKAAKGAAGRLATLSTAVKTRPYRPWPTGWRRKKRNCWPPMKRSRAIRFHPEKAALADWLRPDGGAHPRHGCGIARYRPFAGPARRDAQDVDAPERDAGWTDASSYRRHRDHLRRSTPNVTADSRVVSEIRQRLSPARRVRSAAFQYGIVKVLSESAEKKPVCGRRDHLC